MHEFDARDETSRTASREQVADWLRGYERAWRMPGTDSLRQLFTDDAVYRLSPYEEPVVGLAEIAEMWDAEREGPDQVFTMAPEILAVEGDTTVIRLEVKYGDPVSREYRDLWVVRFAGDGRARAFEEWPFHPGQAYTAPQAREGRAPSASPEVQLDHLVIAVSDWERSNSFYRDILGAEVIELPRRRFAYRLGDQRLNVHGPGSRPQPVARKPVEPGNSDLCFTWPGTAREAVNHLREHGVEIVEGPVERQGAHGQGESVYFRDPDGSLLELIAYEN